MGVSDYIDNIDDIIVFVKEIENPTIIFFNGFLAENRPIKIPDIGEIDKTIRFNYFIPLFLTIMINNKLNAKNLFIFLHLLQ